MNTLLELLRLYAIGTLQNHKVLPHSSSVTRNHSSETGECRPIGSPLFPPGCLALQHF